MPVATRTKEIIENIFICFMYVFISIFDRTNYWIDLISYRINRANYRILNNFINEKD